MAAAYDWNSGQQQYFDERDAGNGEYYAHQDTAAAETSQAEYYWSITSQSMPSSNALPWDEEPAVSYAEEQPGVLYRDSGLYGSVRAPTSQPIAWHANDMLYSSTPASGDSKYPFGEQDDAYSPFNQAHQELFYDDQTLYPDPTPNAYDYLSPLDQLSLDTSPQGTPLSTPLPQSPALVDSPFLPTRPKVTLPPEEANVAAPSMHRRGALSFSLDSLNPVQPFTDPAKLAFKLSPLTKPPTTHFNYEESDKSSVPIASPAVKTRPALDNSTTRKNKQPYKSAYRKNGPEKTFKCDECEQSFNRNHDLKRHKRIHLTVKPFPCGWCDKQFSRKDALKRHLLVGTCGQGLGQRQEDSEKGISTSPAAIAYHESQRSLDPDYDPIGRPKKQSKQTSPEELSPHHSPLPVHQQPMPAFLDTPSTSSESISTSASTSQSISSATSLSLSPYSPAYSYMTPGSPPPSIAPFGTCPPYLIQTHIPDSLGKRGEQMYGCGDDLAWSQMGQDGYFS